MWLTFAVASAVVTAVFVTITKAGLGKVDPSASLAVQATVAVLVAWGATFVRGKAAELGDLAAKDWGLLLLSGALTGAASLLLFLALKDGPSSRVTPVDRLSFVFAAVLAMLFLGEKLTWQVGLGLALMTGGAVLIALSGGDDKPE